MRGLTPVVPIGEFKVYLGVNPETGERALVLVFACEEDFDVAGRYFAKPALLWGVGQCVLAGMLEEEKTAMLFLPYAPALRECTALVLHHPSKGAMKLPLGQGVLDISFSLAALSPN